MQALYSPLFLYVYIFEFITCFLLCIKKMLDLLGLSTKACLNFTIINVLVLVGNLITAKATEECNKFHLAINKEPEFYVPKSSYIVGIESNYVSNAFTSFTLTASPSNKTISSTNRIRNTGWFSLMSEIVEAQFSPDAMNTIIEQDDSVLKQSVHVMWTAPAAGGRDDCVLFHATIHYHPCVQEIQKEFCALQDAIFMSSPLSPPSDSDSKGEDECCACDEATYMITFEGLWSQLTHPKDFPETLPLIHFGEISGCTHSKNLTMWAEGTYATEGLRQIAEFGSSSIMESELLEQKKHLRSLIKIVGLWYPRLNSNVTSKFRVDKKHNLLSLATMIGPSPDWFTGVSKLNLCTKNCSWIKTKSVDLGLYDAGTDNGISYMSPNAPTIPPERVYRITSSYPEDPRAPFYNMHGGEVKPVARLHFRRDRVTPKSCIDEFMFDLNENNDLITDKRPQCATTNYTDWSPCSATCGKGLRARTRDYLNPQLAKQADCNLPTISKKLCMAPTSCPGESDDDSILLSDDLCKTGNWSQWSECTATCGIGFMTRTRQFLKRSSFKKCKHVTTYETKKCMEPPCKTTTIEKEAVNCITTDWSEWSPCSVTCGKGIRVRIRYLIVNETLQEFCKKNMKLEERRDCIRSESCSINKAQAKDVCNLEKEKGLCRGYYQRWYYDSETKQCAQFHYGGCKGNKNNFLTLDECVKICSGI